MQPLQIELLTRAAFMPFGEVIELAGAHQFPINLGTTIRYNDLATLDVAAGGGRGLLNVFRAQPRQLPYAVTMMECHPLGSQAFIPIGDRPYLVVVADGDAGGPAALRAFVSNGWQGVNYARGSWHHPLLALEGVSDFIVIDRGGDGVNLQERDLPEPVWLTTQALMQAR